MGTARHPNLATVRALGVTGGALGLLVWLYGVLTIAVGGMAFQLPGDQFSMISAGLVAGLVANIVAIHAASRAEVRPELAAAYLALACLVDWIVFRFFWIIPGPLLLAGVLFAWFGRSSDGAKPSRPGV